MTKHAAQELNNSDKCRGYMTDHYATRGLGQGKYLVSSLQCQLARD